MQIVHAIVRFNHQVRPSALARFLVTQTMLGACSAYFAARIADLALKDFDLMQSGFDLPELPNLAARTRDRGHAWRDFVQALIPSDVPVAMLPLPIKDSSTCPFRRHICPERFFVHRSS